MKLTKSFWARMVPVFILVVVTAVLSVAVYRQMTRVEEETSWQRLDIATGNTAQKISVRLNDNLNFLEAVSDSFVLINHLEHDREVGEYLSGVMEKTVFERIDVILPNGERILYTGERLSIDGELTFDEVAAKGTHISPRRTSPFTGKEVIYCFTTVGNPNNPSALLCGTIDCESLSKLFEVFTYGDDAQMFLIDCADGNYLLDNWHGNLGNIYDNSIRTGIDGKTEIDMATPIINRESGRMSFISHTNGENSYQCYTPVEDFNWELCVVVQENVAFVNLHKLKKTLYDIAVVEGILVLVYILWNALMTVSATRNEEKAKELELTRATNEAKARFMSNMSHDIRTPLNGIVGMLHIIKNHRDNDALVDDCLDKIEISTQYLATLAGDMLDINEIESNKLVLESVAIDLNSLADELMVLLGPKAKEMSVSYTVDCSGLTQPRVMGSVVHIKRVLVNLIGNSIKYTKGEGGQVRVSMEDNGHGEYRFIVSDNGIGMSEDFQKEMYNAFAQERVTARSDYQGYGLGLTIVYRLVDKMNGKIELVSTKGEGSTFTVILPLEADTEPENEAHDIQEQTNLNGIRVLLAEDNDFNMEIAQVILSDSGAEVICAKDGRAAVNVFKDSAEYFFDLILMDIMMPEMDGCEAAMAIRAMDRTDAQTVPIFAMTANTFTEEINRCRQAGMNEHIAKPLDVEKLIKTAAKYCTDRHGEK